MATLTHWFFSTGLLRELQHADPRKATTELQNHHNHDTGDRMWGHGIMERVRLWGEVHLHREGSSSGGRDRKHQQDTSRALLAQKPRPPTLSQICRGTNCKWRKSGFTTAFEEDINICWLVCVTPTSFHSLSILRQELLHTLKSNFSLSPLLRVLRPRKWPFHQY